MRSSWTNIHNIMLKLCLNPNYKQVLGELRVTTSKLWLNPMSLCGALLRTRVLLDSVQQLLIIKCTWEKAYNTCVPWCTKFRHRLHDDEKVSFVHVTNLYWGNGPRAIKWWNITNAILYIGLMTWCHESLHLEKIPSWSRLKRAHYVSTPLWSFRNHNNISASTKKILIILKWIWSFWLQNYCKKLAKQQVNKIHILINYVWFCTHNAKIIFLKV